MNKKLKNVLIESVKKNANRKETVGLLFSGGLDSSLIGKILIDLDVEVIPITVGLKTSKDITFSKKHSKKLFKNHIIINVNEKIIEKSLSEVIAIINSHNVVDVSVGCVTYLASKYASIFGLEKIFSGLGSDEIFCGYKSHKLAMKKGFNEVQKECENRIIKVKDDLKRDKKISKNFNINIITPFLEKDVIKLGMSIHPKDKINKNSNKIIIRNIAKELGLPLELCERKKIAAQYGSGVQKIIKKISKKEGFETIGHFLKNVYKKQINM